MSLSEAEKEKEKGNEALKANNFALAVECYSRAIALDAKQKVYYSNRSNAYVQLQRYEDALTDANMTIELDPKWSRGWGRKGVALFFLGRYTQAIAAYEEGLRLEPGNESYRSELARCQQFVLAEPFLRPDWSGALSSSALTGKLMEDPKFVEKIQLIRANPLALPSLLNTDNEVNAAYIVLSGKEQAMREQRMREDAKRADEARKRREDAKKREEEAAAKRRQAAFDALPPEKQQATRAKDAGNEAYKKQDFKRALELYTEAAAHDPTSAVYHTNKASAYMGLKDYEAAVAACDKAVEVGKEHHADYETIAKAYFRKGKALAKLKRFRESVAAYDAGLLDFRDPATIKLRAQAEEKAREEEDRAYEDPEKAEAAKNEGNEHFKKENWGDAIRSYSEAIRRNPRSAVYYSNRSITYIKVREYQLALNDADKCLSLDASFVKGWVRKGMAHHHLREYYKALEAYEKGMKIDPNYPELVEWTEKTTTAINRMHGSKEDAEAARQRAAADPEIQRLLKDGEVQSLMRALQANDQRGAQEMLQKSPTLMEKYQKLARTGFLG